MPDRAPGLGNPRQELASTVHRPKNEAAFGPTVAVASDVTTTSQQHSRAPKPGNGRRGTPGRNLQFFACFSLLASFAKSREAQVSCGFDSHLRHQPSLTVALLPSSRELRLGKPADRRRLSRRSDASSRRQAQRWEGGPHLFPTSKRLGPNHTRAPRACVARSTWDRACTSGREYRGAGRATCTGSGGVSPYCTGRPTRRSRALKRGSARRRSLGGQPI
jgi:hypothetical protein